MTLSIPETIRVLLPGGAVKKLALEVYVRGVVAAVLPADAPLEALKAQAVAARTFGAITRRHIERGSDVCTLRHCQLWKDSATASAQRAAQETRGMVAVHNGRLIDAYYFEHCDGSTRDATGVLIQVPPYLKGVTCPCGFATLKGHGIGMCQRGAQVMARFGDSYDTILKHYFTGITVERAVVTPLAAPGQKVAPPPVIPAPVLPPLPETTDRAAKAAPAATPTKTSPALPSTPTGPFESKPFDSAVSGLPPKSGASSEKGKRREAKPPQPTDLPKQAQTPKTPGAIQTPSPTESIRPVEAPKGTFVAPAATPPESARPAEPQKAATVAPAPQPKPIQRAETPKAATIAPKLPPTEVAPPIESQKAVSAAPAPAPAESVRPAETQKVADVAPSTEPESTPPVEAAKTAEIVSAPTPAEIKSAAPPKTPTVAPTTPPEPTRPAEISEAPDAASKPRPAGSARRVDIKKTPEAAPVPLPVEPVRRAGSKSTGVVRTLPLDESTRRVNIPNVEEGAPTRPPTEASGRKAPRESLDRLPTTAPRVIPREPPGTILPTGDLQEEVAWYPTAEDIVAGVAGYEAQVLDDALVRAEKAEPPLVTTIPPVSRSDRSKAAPPGPTAPVTYPGPGTAPDLTPSIEVRQLPPAPESMPEEMPFFPALPVPVPAAVQALPPPLIEEELLGLTGVVPGQVLIDRLPGPRMIAGDLAKPGTIITIRDVDGHAVVTVSGAAPHHGDGGFEAPLASHGTYAVTFDRQSLQVDLDDETVFIQMSS